MYRPRLAIVVRVSVVFAVLAVSVLPLIAGCDLIDQLLGGGTSGGGTTGAPQAAITAEIHDPLVDQGLNPGPAPSVDV